MAMMSKEGYEQAGQERAESGRAAGEAQAPTVEQMTPGGLASTPSDVGGSEPPPPDAGDETPGGPEFPVPPVPPPPSPGPIFSLAGGGGGGAASFARPGTEAAKPFRSPIFTANRSTGMPRFGAGTPVTAGAAPPFLPAGLDGSAEGEAPPDEMERILALLRGGGGV